MFQYYVMWWVAVTMILCFPCHTESYTYMFSFYFTIHYQRLLEHKFSYFSHLSSQSFFVNIFCTLNRHGRGCVFCQVNNNRIEFFEPDTTCIWCVLFIWDEMSFLWNFKRYFMLHFVFYSIVVFVIQTIVYR